MKRLFALMIVVAFTFSMVSFAQNAPKAVKAPKAKVEVTTAKKEVVKDTKATTAKIAKHKAKKAAKKADPKAEVK